MNAGSLKPMKPMQSPADQWELSRQKLLASVRATVQFLTTREAMHLDQMPDARKKWQACISRNQSALDRFELMCAELQKHIDKQAGDGR